MIHRLIYGIAVLGLLHYFIQSKIDVSPATLMAGFFILLMIHRIFISQRMALTPLVLAISAGLAGLLTAITEFAWYALATGVDPWRIAAGQSDGLVRPPARRHCGACGPHSLRICNMAQPRRAR